MTDLSQIPTEQLLGMLSQHAAMPSQPQEVSQGRTALDQGLQGATFGFADEISDRLGAGIASAYTGDNYSDILKEARGASKQRLQAEWQQHLPTALASNVVGSLATGGVGAETNAGKTLASSLGRGGLAARAAKGAAAGAASGGLYGAGAADEGQRLEGAGQGAIYGAGFGAALPAAGAALSGLAGGTKTALKGAFASGAEDLDQAGAALKQVSTNAYQGMRNAGATLNRAGASKVTYAIGKELSDSGLMNGDLHSGTLSVLKDLNADTQSGSLTLEKLDQYRQLLSQVVRKNTTKLDGANPDAFKATQAISALDDAVDSLGSQHLSSGTPDAIKTLNDARSAWSQYSKFDRISGIIQNAEGDPNKIKQGLQTFLKNDKNTRGLSPEELSALENAATRSNPEKLLRGLGTFGFDIGKTKNLALPAIATGSSALVPGGIPLVAAGTAARQVGKYMARGKAEDLLNVIKGGAPPVAPRINGPSGVVPAMLEGTAAGGLAAPKAQIPTININTPGGLPNVDLPSLSPQGNAGEDTLQGGALGNALLDRISRAESGGNPNAQAKTSSASGEFQFTNPTWKAMVAKHPEAGIGIGDKNNPTAQQKMAALLLQDNSQALQGTIGRQPSGGELYIAHFLGAGGAAKLINHADDNVSAASLFPQAATANRSIFYDHGRPLTTGEVYAKLLSKVENQDAI